MASDTAYPQRIVCLTEETTETLYLLHEDWRIVGISGFTVRPPRARREKPKVSAFTSADVARIRALHPDLVLGFSDLQAGIAADLIRAGLEVHVFNHRSVAEVLRMVRTLGGMIGCADKAERLARELENGLAAVRERATQLARRPRVYFEEWDEPPISCIRWVSELIEAAGGEDCFPELAAQPLGRDRLVADPLEVARRAPDIILGSWCGKKFRPERVVARPGCRMIADLISCTHPKRTAGTSCQPGPAALTDGVRAVQAAIFDWAQRTESAHTTPAS